MPIGTRAHVGFAGGLAWIGFFAGQELQRYEQEEQAARHLHGFHGDVEETEDIGSEQAEDGQDACGDGIGLPSGPGSFLRGEFRC